MSRTQVFEVRGRRGGKRLITRQMTESAARAGEHVHYLDSSGTWCVTCHGPLGLVWALAQGCGGHVTRPQPRTQD